MCGGRGAESECGGRTADSAQQPGSFVGLLDVNGGAGMRRGKKKRGLLDVNKWHAAPIHTVVYQQT